MKSIEQQYLDLVKEILETGNNKSDRTGTGTKSLFGRELRHNFKDGFPLMTTRQISLKTAFTELKWFLLGRSDLKWLLENNCKIWVGDFYKRYVTRCEKEDFKPQSWLFNDDLLSKDQFCERILNDSKFRIKFDDAKRLYGKQWRDWDYKYGHDQIEEIIKTLKTSPDSRRMLVTSWNPTDLYDVLLQPCHTAFQVYTRELSINERIELFKKEWEPSRERIDPYYFNNPTHEMLQDCSIPTRAMSLRWQQRSVDTLLGFPTNLISYSMLLMMLCKKVNMIPEEISCSLGDVHIYNDQIEMAKELITREPLPFPTLSLSNRIVEDISEYDWKDFTLENYNHHPKMTIPLSN